MKARLLFLTMILMAMQGMGSVGFSQSPASPLEKARADFTATILSGSRQLNEQYDRALTKLEEELAVEGNYEEALAVQNRVADLRRILAKSPIEEPKIPISLSLTSAQLNAVNLDEGFLTRWRSAISHAEWSVQKITPGTYVIEFSYNVSNGSSLLASPSDPLFRLQDVSLLASSANFRDVSLKRSDDSVTFNEARTEPITFPRGSFTLRMESIKTSMSDTIRINGVRLVPAGLALPNASLPTPEVTLKGENEVESLRQIFLKRLSTVRAPLLSAYGTKLKTLQAQPSILADGEISELIAAEQKRIASDSPLGSRMAKNGNSSKIPGANLEGFEDISGVQWVSDAANTAERFKVSHEGREFWIKLAWVKSPPPTPENPGELHSAAKAFGIAEDDALSIGRIAAEYARGHMEGKPLRLLVRTQRIDKKDAAPALVFLDGTGFLQAMLIDYGFAAYTPPEGSGQKTMIEMAMMRMLQERQEKAKTKVPSPGAWAFRADQNPKP